MDVESPGPDMESGEGTGFGTFIGVVVCTADQRGWQEAGSRSPAVETDRMKQE